MAQGVLSLRERYPRWGKDKLVVLLRREGWGVSTSMTGRILKRLKARGVLRNHPYWHLGSEAQAKATANLSGKA